MMNKLLNNLAILIAAGVLCCVGILSVNAQDIIGMKMHETVGLECINCHNSELGDQKSKNMTPTCVNCHAPGERYYHGMKDAAGYSVLKEYSESGRIRTASFHDSHGGEIRCTVCHTSHQQKPQQLYCNNCHQFDVKIK
ncbi:cytochrome c3 family protein [Budvicia aquatica]|uniref:Fumarate reductase flavoprotein subunit n=2 Tax=Budvicia aquatica TaxID=82979 RepID=A0A484ZND2_9GAMM|nr:cytochrome c3 family protein [Budvicia aquatica]VFS50137.1 Fumarate reductase flavoprotein subunit precursor [Budvicia aquatica]